MSGKERLFGQTQLHDHPPPLKLEFDILTELLASTNVETCLQHVSLVLKHVEPAVRKNLVLYAIHIFRENSQGRTFEIEANAVLEELHFVEESKGGWTTCIPAKSIVPVNECCICLEDLSDVDKE